MATQSYIIAQESVLIDAGRAASQGKPVDVESARKAIHDTAASYVHEKLMNGGIIPANRDCWSTLAVNTSYLARVCPDLATEANGLADLIGVYRGPSL